MLFHNVYCEHLSHQATCLGDVKPATHLPDESSLWHLVVREQSEPSGALRQIHHDLCLMNTVLARRPRGSQAGLPAFHQIHMLSALLFPSEWGEQNCKPAEEDS